MSNSLFSLDDELNPSLSVIFKKAKAKVGKAARKGKKWIQGAVEEGTFRDYMKQRYGDRAFTKRGTLKVEYIHRVIDDPDTTQTTKRRARLALTLRRF